MDFVIPHSRTLGPLTLGLGALTICAFFVLSWTAAPLALLFVVAAFVWSLSRVLDPAPAGTSGCTGCAAGCVRCRERIDAGT